MFALLLVVWTFGTFSLLPARTFHTQVDLAAGCSRNLQVALPPVFRPDERNLKLAATTLRGSEIFRLAAGRSANAVAAESESQPKRVAAIVTAYYQNSHADVIVSRLLETQTLDGKGETTRLKLVSLYIDQVPANDKSRRLA